MSCGYGIASSVGVRVNPTRPEFSGPLHPPSCVLGEFPDCLHQVPLQLYPRLVLILLIEGLVSMVASMMA